jgi:hypothetical protein
LAGPPRPPEVIRHARKDRLLESFEKNVWSLRFRCSGCHMPGGTENARLVEENGERVSWIKPEGAEATMSYLIRSRLINPKQPERSLLLRKPLNEVKHGGGQKMLPGDMGYQAFRRWLEDYAAVVGDGYKSPADLPREADSLERFGTEVWLKLADTPADWGDRLLQVTLYAWDAKARSWEAAPIAVSDRGVWGKGRLWQHNLVLIAAKGSLRAETWKQEKPTLPPGRYLLKVHVDLRGRLARDWKASLGEDEFVGQAEVESRWPQGYGQMTVLRADQLRR